MKKIGIIALLLLPHFVFSQGDFFKIKGSFESKLVSPAVIQLISDTGLVTSISSPTNFEFEYEITSDSIQIVWLKVVYKDDSNRVSDLMPVYCSPGILSVVISNAKEKALSAKFSGAKESVDYYNNLYLPVTEYGNKGRRAWEKYLKAKNAGSSDSTFYKNEARKNSHLGFQVNRDFIKLHLSSLVSIEALNMMGDGDRTTGAWSIADPVKDLQDLFNSLSPVIQNSKEGNRYKLKLKELKERTKS